MPTASSTSASNSDYFVVAPVPRSRLSSVTSLFAADSRPAAAAAATSSAADHWSTPFAQYLPPLHNELLLEDFAAALHREILIQGRVYVTSNFIFFRSQLLLKETTVAIPFSEVIDIRKDTLLLIPNVIVVLTKTAKYSFASIFDRDKVFNQLVLFWNFEKNLPEDPSTIMSESPAQTAPTPSGASVTAPSTGPASTDLLPLPVQCGCRDHYSGEFVNAQLDMDAESAWTYMFSDHDTTGYFRNLCRVNGTTELQIGSWEQTGGKEARKLSYIVPVNKAVGPKRALVEEEQELRDIVPQRRYIVETRVRTPHVMYGDAFVTYNRYCITQIEENRCQLLITAEVRYTKSVWAVVKTFIEHNTQDSLQVHFPMMLAELKTLPDIKKSGGASLAPVEPAPLLASPAVVAPTPVHHHAPVVNTSSESGISDTKSRSMLTPVTIVLVSLSVLLLLTNLYIFMRMYSVESRIANVHLNAMNRVDSLLNNQSELPKDNQEWLMLLRHVVSAHSREIAAWREVASNVQSSLASINRLISSNSTYAARTEL